MERVLFSGVEFKRESKEGSDSRNIVTGYAMRWDDEADLGWFRETFEKGAFKGRMDDTVFLIGHDRGIPLASVNGDTLSLREDEKGLYFRVELSEESQRANEVLIAIERNDLTDVSVGFSLSPDGEYKITEDKEKSTLYTILRVASLNEISFVYRGAYPKAKIARAEQLYQDYGDTEKSVLLDQLEKSRSAIRATELRMRNHSARLRSAAIL